MITLPIYIFDKSEKEKAENELQENETLGFEKYKVDPDRLKVKYVLVDFHINENHLHGFWIDPGKDDDSNSFNDIIAYIGSSSFRIPFSNERVILLTGLLSK